jgi:catechol 2,3-dioxygenase-like lactoylglutathione lyase family enzyme
MGRCGLPAFAELPAATFGEPSDAPEGRLVLSASKLVCFLATARPAESRRFYQGILGLSMLEDGPFALVFDANGTELRIQKVQAVAPAPYTALGWQVPDIEAAARWLGGRGISLERYDGLSQDDLGIWRTPDGSGVAWFKDPEGHTLSVTQRGQAPWPRSA